MIDFRNIDRNKYYMVYIYLTYSIDGRSTESIKIEKISGYDLKILYFFSGIDYKSISYSELDD